MDDVKEDIKRSAKLMDSLKQIISYQWIVDNVAFFLFLGVLAVIYIANGHQADKVLRDTNAASSQIKELQFEYKTLKSELMFQSRESEVIKGVAPYGLKMSNDPPMRIKLLTKNDQKEE